MNRHFCQLYWYILRIVIRNSKVAVIVTTAIISTLIFQIGEFSEYAAFLFIPKNTWTAVTGSVLASTIFLCIQWLISKLQEAEKDTYLFSYERLVDLNGIKDIHSQRGNPEILALYRKCVENAERRIWAIGMTNRHFKNQHYSNALVLAQKSKIDIKIAFWHPSVSLVNDDTGAKINILELQQKLEGGIQYYADWKKGIEEVQNEIILLAKKDKLIGEVGIYNFMTAANISCFIIDDDVFFFPFLARTESTNDPMIHCTAEIGVGKTIDEHFGKLFHNPSTSNLVFSSTAG